VNDVLKVAAAGIVLGIAGAILLFAWRVTQYLTEMSVGIILGIAATALVVALILLPLSFLLLRSRQLDTYEFLASQSRMRAPTFDVSLLPPEQRGPLPFGGRSGAFNLLDISASSQDDEENF